MKTALWMALAIVCEVSWAIGIKFIHAWKPWPVVLLTGVTYVLSIVFLAIASRKLEIGTAYAIWAGCGISLIAAIGMVFLKESAHPLRVASLALVVIGVIGLHVTEGLGQPSSLSSKESDQSHTAP